MCAHSHGSNGRSCNTVSAQDTPSSRASFVAFRGAVKYARNDSGSAGSMVNIASILWTSLAQSQAPKALSIPNVGPNLRSGTTPAILRFAGSRIVSLGPAWDGLKVTSATMTVVLRPESGFTTATPGHLPH